MNFSQDFFSHSPQTSTNPLESQMSTQKDSDKCLPSFLLKDISTSSLSSNDDDCPTSQRSQEETEGFEDNVDFPIDIYIPSSDKSQREKKLGPPTQHKFYSVDDIPKHGMFHFPSFPPTSNTFNQRSLHFPSFQQTNLSPSKNMNNYLCNMNNMSNMFNQISVNGYNQFQRNFNVGYNANMNNGMSNIQNTLNLLKPQQFSNIVLNGNFYPHGGLNTPPSIQLKMNNNKMPKQKKSPKKATKKKKMKKNQMQSSDCDVFKPLNILSFSEQELYCYIITQRGSRDAQTTLSKYTEKELDILISKLSINMGNIMLDKYGNYFIKCLIQYCSPKEREEILKSVENRFTEIACDSFGTHPLQVLIEIINMPNERKILLRCIEGHEVELSLNSKGTHVIQKFISCFPEKERENVNKNILENIPKLIIDSFGVCVLIKLIKHTKNIQIKEVIGNYISTNNPLTFIQNPYANYVVQSLLNEREISFCEEIVKAIKANFFALSTQKFSSNVVENCIKYCEEKSFIELYDKAISNDKLRLLLTNTYGSFVLEMLLGRLNKEQKRDFIKEIARIGEEKHLTNSMINLLYRS